MNKPVIVLDKCYLQGSTQDEIHRLCTKYTVVMPEALFFELLTTDAKVRTACFRKFPVGDNPVEIVTHVGSLLAHERQTHTPATPLHDRVENSRFVFNPKLSTGDMVFNDQHLAGIKEWEADIANSVAEFKERASVTHRWFPSLEGYKPGMQRGKIDELRHAVASDHQMIRDIYGAIRHESFPPASAIDEQWALYRWVQVQLLAALEYIRRYGIGNALETSKRIPNDVIDMQYAVTGALAGALASRDAAIQETFTLLCPEGQLLS